MTDQPIEKDLLEILSQDGYQVLPVPGKIDLAEDAHIEQSDLNKLLFSLPAGNPNDSEWMGKYVNNQNYDSLPPLPEDFTKFYNLFRAEGERQEISNCVSVLTYIANLNKDLMTPEQILEYKELYKLAEMRIMHHVKQKISAEILLDNADFPISPEKIINALALNGALIFEGMFSEFGKSIKIEMKRLKMKDGTYTVGVGKQFETLFNLSQLEKDKIEVVNLPDDCISTGMSQGGSVQILRMAGFRNIKKIVIPATVAVGGGLNYLRNKVKQIYPECELVLAAGAVCYSVTENMYLQTSDGKAMVGDMGFWGRVETGKTPPSGRISPVRGMTDEIAKLNEQSSPDEIRKVTEFVFPMKIIEA